MENENSTSGESSTQFNEFVNRGEKKTTRSTRQRGSDSDKFLHNFDPERSEREKRKLHRRLYQGHKKHAIYNEKGVLMQTGDDLCDCLNLSCAGCHFPCLKCSSPKCGHECRMFRKWMYDSIENEGSDVVIKNPLNKESAT